MFMGQGDYATTETAYGAPGRKFQGLYGRSEARKCECFTGGRAETEGRGPSLVDLGDGNSVYQAPPGAVGNDLTGVPNLWRTVPSPDKLAGTINRD